MSNVLTTKILPIVLIVALFGVTFYGLSSIASDTQLPVHFDISGNADWFLPRNQALAIFPVFAVLLAGLVMVRTRSQSAQAQASKYVLQTTLCLVLFIFLGVQSAFVAIGMGMAVDIIRLTAVMIAILLIGLGNVLPKSQANNLVGIRLPWTMSNAKVWTQTHRVGGIAFILSGAVLGLLALTLSNRFLVGSALLASIFVPLVFISVYSFLLSKKA